MAKNPKTTGAKKSGSKGCPPRAGRAYLPEGSLVKNVSGGGKAGMGKGGKGDRRGY